MSRTKKILVSTGAALGLSSVALAQTADLDIDRAYAAELRADASRHASLLQSGGSGYDGQFHIGDASGNNRLNIGLLHQFRYIANFTDNNDSSVVTEDFTGGFESQRGVISFTGNVINPQITFDVSLDLGLANRGDDLPSILRNAYVQYNFEGEGSGWYARWGQFKAPILNEENIHSGKQLAVERGPVNEFFTPSWSEGVMVGYLAEQFGVHFMFSDGVRTPITAIGPTASTAFNGADADIALTVRGDWKVMGAWEQFDDFTSFRGSDRAFKVGGGFHWQSGGDTGMAGGGGVTADVEYWMWTIDAQYEADGWNLSAGYVGSTIDVTGGIDVTNHGVYVQGGVFLADQWELFGRWDWLALDEDFTGTGEEDFHYVTVGTNYYFVPESHALKFTGDVVYAIDESATGVGGTTTNLGDTGLQLGTDGEWALRLQLQVLF